MHFGDATLPLQDHDKSFRKELDREMRFDQYLKNIGHQSSLQVSALLRVVGYLDAKGVMVLCKPQIRPYLT